MTDREKAIVMAYTGVTMLTGNKYQIFHKYIEEIMGRPIWTHEMAQLADEIKEKSKADFMALCADENPNEWIPCSERLPDRDESVLAYHRDVSFDYQYVSWIDDYSGKWAGFCGSLSDEVLAWMPLPEGYKEKKGSDGE